MSKDVQPSCPSGISLRDPILFDLIKESPMADLEEPGRMGMVPLRPFKSPTDERHFENLGGFLDGVLLLGQRQDFRLFLEVLNVRR
jgi:hypothetical protein